MGITSHEATENLHMCRVKSTLVDNSTGSDVIELAYLGEGWHSGN